MPDSAADCPSLRFAILHHLLPTSAGRANHFDLLLEWNAALLTWELPTQPLLADGSCAARRLPDHRLKYLDYSGSLSGNRGEVRQVAGGALVWQQSPKAEATTWTARLTHSRTPWLISLTAPAADQPNWVVEWRRLE